MRNLFRIAAAVPAVHVGNVSSNVEEIGRLFEQSARTGAAAVLFPELAVTGASCGDLFEQKLLLDAAYAGLHRLIELSRSSRTILLAGLPVAAGGRLFNACAVIQSGKLAGFALRSFPGAGRFDGSARHFAPAAAAPREIEFDGVAIPCGNDLVFRAGELRFGVETGADLAAPVPNCVRLALNGAAVIFNPCATEARIGAGNTARDLVSDTGRRLCCAVASAGCGVHESTANSVCAGHALIGTLGRIHAENDRFNRESGMISCDVDLEELLLARRRNRFGTTADTAPVREIVLSAAPVEADAAQLYLPRRPFVPDDPAELSSRCLEIMQITSSGLAKRWQSSRSARLVVGLSGGLDSTLAILVAVHAAELLGFGHDAVIAITMPGFGTSDRTRNNAAEIARLLGTELRTIPIAAAVRQHFKDIGHDPTKLDVVYENSQARERTQIMMDVANAENALVVGTGDLSETALGWCTFNGDHMAMYGVNASIPKTLIRAMVEFIARCSPDGLREHLLDVAATPVSPELLPGAQHTEKLIGSYELHDFYLSNMLRRGRTPAELLELARIAFGDAYTPKVLRDTLKLFLHRFFTQQFKRNVMPDAPAVGTISLSSHGDWCMPPDADAQAWFDAL